MSAAVVVVLPVVWATGPVDLAPRREIEPEMAFYRKYTESLLRRYVKMSMEAGKVPSMLGKEMFHGRVTNYRVQGFEDVVIFVHDIERCLKKLDEMDQKLITRIALQQYTHAETAGMLRLPRRTVIRRYDESVDRLTRIFLDVGVLEPFVACQGG